MVDFSKLISEDASAAPLNPAEIFHSLPRTGTKYDYLRDVQGEVLKEWHTRRTERDVVVKMNTGSGKTLVGLLMLQSLLNEELGPAVYLCPNKLLVAQVCDTARQVGITAVTSSEGTDLPHEFLNSEAIYITNFMKLFNGRSVFGGAGSSRQVVSLGGVLIDDAHSCLTIAREKVTVTLEAGTDGYSQILALFRSALATQSQPKLAEVLDGNPRTVMPVPYWAWIDSQQALASILAALRETPPLIFTWDLIKDDLSACHCFISGSKLQITPHLVPTDVIPSYAHAKRRFFLSATLVDDSILLKEFGVAKNAVIATIRPPIIGDMGRRMILAPSLIDNALDPTIPNMCKTIADEGYNVVVLVPSFAAGDRWKKAGAVVVEDDIGATVEKLRTSKRNFVVLANRYDGIDLPDDACRVLVLDGVPRGESYYEQHITSVRSDSALVIGRVAQTIEQGLGRGVRSGTDYCVSLLCGSDLVRFVGVKDRLNLFSPETKQQFLIGQELAKQSKQDKGASDAKLIDLMNMCLKDDPGWRSYHAKKMIRLAPAKQDATKLDFAISEYAAWVRYRAGNSMEAGDILQKHLDSVQVATDSDRGWFLQMAANYTHAADPNRAQEMQRRAFEWNRYVLRPVAGVRYQKMIAKAGLQAQNVLLWVQTHTDPNAVAVSVDALVNDLVFSPSNNRFEQAWAELGRILGFRSEQPEEELGKGPDGLWVMPDQQYLLTEIKSGVELDRTEIYQSEAEQMSNSANWFHDRYGDVPVTLLMVHPSNKLAGSAYPPEKTKVMTLSKLEELHTRLRNFAAAVSSKSPDSWTVSDLGALLVSHRLDAGSIRTNYCVPAKH